jgi:hypothetical protein
MIVVIINMRRQKILVHCYLEELNSSNESKLLEMLNIYKDEYRQTVYSRHENYSPSEFRERLHFWFLNGRRYQFVIYEKGSTKAVGTVFFYGLDPTNSSIKLSCFFEPKIRKSLVVGESLGLSIFFAYTVLKIQNILFSVYKTNVVMSKIVSKIRAETVFSGENSDLYKLSEPYVIKIVEKINILERQ